MFRILISFMLVLITSLESLPLADVKAAEILKYENRNDGTGNYKFFFETGNNIKQEEVGELKELEPHNPVVVVRGFYSYTRDDGKEQKVHYVADEQGFHPEVNKVTGGSDFQFKPPPLPTIPTGPTTTRKPQLVESPVPIKPIGQAALGSLTGGGLSG